MKISELRKLNIGELEDKQRELTDDLFHLKFQSATGQLENGNQIRFIRRDIARINTLLGQDKNSHVIAYARQKYGKVIEEMEKKTKTPVGLKTRVRMALDLVSSDMEKIESEVKFDLSDKIREKMVQLQKELSTSVTGKDNRKGKGKTRGISDSDYKAYLRLKELNGKGKISLSAKDLKLFANLEGKAPSIKELIELKKVRFARLAEKATLVRLEKLLQSDGQAIFAGKAE